MSRLGKADRRSIQEMADVYTDKARKLDGPAATQLLDFANALRKCGLLKRPCGINPCPWCLARRIDREREKVLYHLKAGPDDEFHRVACKVPGLVPSRGLPGALDALHSATIKLTRGKKVWANRVGAWAGRLRVRPRTIHGRRSTVFRLSASFLVGAGSGLDLDALEGRWRDLLLEEKVSRSSNSPLVSVSEAGPLRHATRRLCGSAAKTLGGIATMLPVDVLAYLASLEGVHRPALGIGSR